MKILYVATISKTINAFLIPHIKMLIGHGYTVHICCNEIEKLDDELIVMGCKVFLIKFKRNPIHNSFVKQIRQLRKLIKDERYDMIHTHTPIASAIVRIACRNYKYLKVLYTVHGFHFHKGGRIINWLLYYPIEKILSRYTDVLITINREDYNIAKKYFRARQTIKINGIGFDYKSFLRCSKSREKTRKEMIISDDTLIFLSVGELNKNKNHLRVIKALKNFNEVNYKYLICGEGPQRKLLQRMINRYNLSDRIILLGYRKDVRAIYSASDLFIFPSLREGLGLSAIEAMASGLPVIASDIHGIKDYTVAGKTGYAFNPKSICSIKKAIFDFLENKEKWADFSKFNSSKVEIYDYCKVLNEMKTIYEYNSDYK